jgi:hypothetical protein
LVLKSIETWTSFSLKDQTWDLDSKMTLRHLARSQLVKCHLANTYWKLMLVETSEPVMVLSIERTGAKFGEGM